MQYVSIGARILLGVLMFFFGLNGFFQFVQQPALDGAAAAFMGGLAQSGYFFPFLKLTEVVVGVMLLSGFFVPLALVVLAPISIHIFLFHVFLAPSGIAVAIVIVALHSYLGWHYRDRYASILRLK